ncbi:hypothetical protein [Corynebacterium auriscanis]|uniref:hypothetical protein n=1 Tax=Corynebacterium auriscanis TaxID=99807 RepID=UPI003CEFD450
MKRPSPPTFFKAARLVKELTRELQIIAQLPRKPTRWFSKNNPTARKARRTSQQILEAIQPLADSLNPPAEPLKTPDVTCMPEGLDLGQYLKVLRWLFEDEETLNAIAFPYEPGNSKPGKVTRQQLDATWSALDSNLIQRSVQRLLKKSRRQHSSQSPTGVSSAPHREHS